MSVWVSNSQFVRQIEARDNVAWRLSPHLRRLAHDGPPVALLHPAVTAAKLCGRSDVRAVIAENLLLKQQLIVLRRARHRGARTSGWATGSLFGLGSLSLSPGRIRKIAIGVRPAALLTFHQALIRRKFS